MNLPRSILVASTAASLLIAQQYDVHRYGPDDGLPSSQVYSVEQGPDGVMWFATGSGVVSFDGCNWRKHDGSSKRSWRFVVPIGGGSFWTMTEHTPVHVARGGDEAWSVSPTAPLPRDAIPSSLLVSDAGVVLAGTIEHGVAAFADGAWSRLPVAGRQDYEAEAIACRGSTLLVGSSDGLWRFDLNNLDQPATRVRGLPKGAVLGLAYDHEQLWVAQNQWLGLIPNLGEDARTATSSELVAMHSTPVTLEPDRHGSVLIGSSLGVYRVDKAGAISTWGRDQGLVDATATDVEVDLEGNIWITAMRGISKVAANDIVRHTSVHGLFADEVCAICRRGDNRYVVGHEGGLTLLEDGQRKRIDFSGERTAARVLDLELAPDGRMWIASSWRGLGELSTQQDITWHETPHQVQAVAVTNDGVMVGTSAGLWRFDAGKWQRAKHDQPLLHESVRRLTVDSDGALWGATSKSGIWRLGARGDLKQWKSRLAPESDVFGVVEWRDRRFVGSRAGLLEIVGDEIVPASDYRIDRPVYGFAIDQLSQSLWVGTNQGVAILQNTIARWLQPSTGLLGHEINRDALLIDADGVAYIGTNGGLNVTHAGGTRPRRPEPRLSILSEDTQATAVTFRFRVDSYLNERYVQFRYRLDGLEEGWTGPIELPDREIRFANLPAGDYRLNLVATTPDGRRSAEVMSALVNIPTPVYQRGWFILIAVLIAATLTFSAFLTAAQRRYAGRLEAEVNERTLALAESERAAQQERAQLTTMLHSIADGVAAADGEGSIFLWNRAAEQLTGIPRDQAIGRNIHQLLGLPEDTGVDGSTRIRLSDSRQEQDSFEAMVAPFGAGKQLVVAFRDIRQRVADERDLAHRQRLESLGLLAGGIAHDFNNYLTVILGTLTMLEGETALSDDQRTQVQLAAATSARAEELTKQLLTFSTGGAPVRTSVDIEKLLNDAISIALSGSQIVGRIQVRHGLPPAKIDHGQISQVLHNLLLNARQAMPEGGEVTIRAELLAEDRKDFRRNAWLVVEVEDNGPGMPPDVQRRIFDPFFSGRGGTGLGLAVAHSIITRHGGTISATSESGVGSRFELLLPASEEALESKEPTTPASEQTSLRILVMDDEPSIRQLFADMLNHLGHECVAVVDGAEAIERFEKGTDDGAAFDLAIFDLTVVGGIGGREAAGVLLARHPSARLIAVSGYSTDSVLGQHAQNGFRDALPKPFGLQTLQETIARVMRTTDPGR